MMMMVVFWVAVIALVVWLLLELRPDRATGAPEHPRDPEELLVERFARGEIDKEEYAHRRAVLDDE